MLCKRIRVVSPKFYTVRKKFTGPLVPPVLTNLKSEGGKYLEKENISFSEVKKNGGGKYLEQKYYFFGRGRKTEKEKEENI